MLNSVQKYYYIMLKCYEIRFKGKNGILSKNYNWLHVFFLLLMQYEDIIILRSVHIFFFFIIKLLWITDGKRK